MPKIVREGNWTVVDPGREGIDGPDVRGELDVGDADLGARADGDGIRELDRELRRHGELADVDALAQKTAAERVRVFPRHAEAVRAPEADGELHVVRERQDAVPVSDRVKPLTHLRVVAVPREGDRAVELGRGAEDDDAASLQGLSLIHI